MAKKSTMMDKLKTLQGNVYVRGAEGIGTGLMLKDIIGHLMGAGGKDGGRVTPRGIGKAKRGFGKAMKRKR
jgi:hypothetical protein